MSRSSNNTISIEGNIIKANEQLIPPNSLNLGSFPTPGTQEQGSILYNQQDDTLYYVGASSGSNVWRQLSVSSLPPGSNWLNGSWTFGTYIYTSIIGDQVVIGKTTPDTLAKLDVGGGIHSDSQISSDGGIDTGIYYFSGDAQRFFTSSVPIGATTSSDKIISTPNQIHAFSFSGQGNLSSATIGNLLVSGTSYFLNPISLSGDNNKMLFNNDSAKYIGLDTGNNNIVISNAGNNQGIELESRHVSVGQGNNINTEVCVNIQSKKNNNNNITIKSQHDDVNSSVLRVCQPDGYVNIAAQTTDKIHFGKLDSDNGVFTPILEINNSTSTVNISGTMSINNVPLDLQDEWTLTGSTNLYLYPQNGTAGKIMLGLNPNNPTTWDTNSRIVNINPGTVAYYQEGDAIFETLPSKQFSITNSNLYDGSTYYPQIEAYDNSLFQRIPLLVAEPTIVFNDKLRFLNSITAQSTYDLKCDSNGLKVVKNADNILLSQTIMEMDDAEMKLGSISATSGYFLDINKLYGLQLPNGSTDMYVKSNNNIYLDNNNSSGALVLNNFASDLAFLIRGKNANSNRQYIKWETQSGTSQGYLGPVVSNDGSIHLGSYSDNINLNVGSTKRTIISQPKFANNWYDANNYTLPYGYGMLRFDALGAWNANNIAVNNVVKLGVGVFRITWTVALPVNYEQYLTVSVGENGFIAVCQFYEVGNAITDVYINNATTLVNADPGVVCVKRYFAPQNYTTW